MNYIVVEIEERLNLLQTVIERLPQSTVIVYSQKQIDFYQELFHHLGINSKFSTTPTNGSNIFLDPQQPQGKGLLFVFPESSEIDLTKFKQSQLMKSKWRQFTTVETEKLVKKNFRLNQLAEIAYRDFIANYAQKFDVDKIDPNRICKAFGFDISPKLSIIKMKKSSEYKKSTNKQGITKKIKKIQKADKQSKNKSQTPKNNVKHIENLQNSKVIKKISQK
ncbi:ATP-dependent RNA helicase [Paramecium bursaria]